jgi:hypothetical protein
MSSLEKGLHTYLSSSAGSALTALISTRLYWLTAPNRVTKPYCVYQIIGDNDRQLWFGGDTGDAIVQFDVIADTKSGKDAIYALRDILRGYNGILGSVQTVISTVSNIREFDVTDTTGPEYQFQIDFSIQFEY